MDAKTYPSTWRKVGAQGVLLNLFVQIQAENGVSGLGQERGKAWERGLPSFLDPRGSLASIPLARPFLAWSLPCRLLLAHPPFF